MFDNLSDKLEKTFRALKNRGKLTVADVETALAEIRLALLDADVNLNVTKDFLAVVLKKATGQKVMKSLSPGQMVIKIVRDELIAMMGKHEPLDLNYAPPVVMLLAGLQGSGKTTTCGKLALHLKRDLRRRPLMVSVDVYRPAAIEQLGVVGKSIGVEVFPSEVDQNPVKIAKDAVIHAQNAGYDVLLIDTAGRLQIDAGLMNELADIVEEIQPHEVLLVADAMTGQEAVNVALGFDKVLDIDGVVLTKMDGDARGGAALSTRAVLGKPIKFIGMGEASDALQEFHPDRMVSRILGMGDVESFIEKASKEIDEKDVRRMEKKIRKNDFSLGDFYDQLQTIKKMGSLESLMSMMPGAGKIKQQMANVDSEKAMSQIESIILSMTKAEREDYGIINGSRKKRIANGSGMSVEDVNRLLKQFVQMRKMMRKMSKLGPKGLKGLGSLGNLMGQ